METIKQGTKVYIISKSQGCSLAKAVDRVKDRIKHGDYPETKIWHEITYKGKTRSALIGWYSKMSGGAHVIDYNTKAQSGDFYKRTDFITEQDLIKDSFQLEGELFEI